MKRVRQLSHNNIYHACLCTCYCLHTCLHSRCTTIHYLFNLRQFFKECTNVLITNAHIHTHYNTCAQQEFLTKLMQLERVFTSLVKLLWESLVVVCVLSFFVYLAPFLQSPFLCSPLPPHRHTHSHNTYTHNAHVIHTNFSPPPIQYLKELLLLGGEEKKRPLQSKSNKPVNLNRNQLYFVQSVLDELKVHPCIFS